MRQLVLALGSFFFIVQTSAAQSNRLDCPELESGASVERQVLCWFEKEQKGSKECTDDQEKVDICLLQTARWCSEAVLDEAQVANTCFLAHLRNGQFGQAFSIIRYIQTPNDEIAMCEKALQNKGVKFVSIPAGAELLIDGQSYGKAPIEVELQDYFWRSNRKVILKFGNDEVASEVEVSKQDLMTQFDRLTCTMKEMVVKGPEPSEHLEPMPQALSTEIPSGIPVETPVKTPGKVLSDEKTGVLTPAAVSIALGCAGIITGGLLVAIAASRASDLSSPKDGTPWTQDLMDKDQSVKSLSIGGFISLGIGATLTTIGVLLLMKSEGAPADSVDNIAQNISNSSQLEQGIQLARWL